ncbi:small T antigen [Meles meles polyomavirus 1]|uniref:Small t antigen n=1 Tax=Meles meles polyomavirus 1 TaxID=1608323 RepID=A0A0B5L789_9POLY|nr:small T antigen [Meles meles polyomavirus 1]AJG44389.1 small T antigen [Meles meles polyomavirus 1]AJG44394.1 small T antigen [Meles meles polyomavirus 1]
MDGALSREESIKLMQLLGLPMQMYGHIPVMRKAFLQKSKEYHPDKGGDEETFKTLCGLYRKLENSLRSQTDFEKAWEENAEGSWSTSDVSKLGNSVEFYRSFDLCQRNVNPKCRCLMCRLKRKHIWRLKEFRSPNSWGMCYCYSCYCQWFGFEEKNFSSVTVWISTMAEMTWGEINVW